MRELAEAQRLGLLTRAPAAVPIPSQDAPRGTRHRFSAHTPLWAYIDPRFQTPYARDAGARPLFDFLPAGSSVPQALQKTRCLVFLGACDSEEFAAAFDEPDAIKLVFEPDPEICAAFLQDKDPAGMARASVFFLVGDPTRLNPSLSRQIPPEIRNYGFPAFFIQEGLDQALPEAVQWIVEHLEVLYYRHAIYDVERQDNNRGLPLRTLHKEHFYDQMRHWYGNLHACLTSGDLSDLKNAFPGSTAILAAAGPALRQQTEFIARNQDRAVVIAVNGALKPLLSCGVEPHFVIINDNCLLAGESLTGLPRLTRSRLVGHCLSASGRGAFPFAHFFSNPKFEQPFPERDELPLHGSVITTAFSLAEYMGCSRAILAGAQLAFDDPWRLDYAPGCSMDSIERAGEDAEPAALINRYPQFYPVQGLDGSRLYTTVNYYDVSWWFAERVAEANLEVVNLTGRSIIKGPGIRYDPRPAVEDQDVEARFRALPCTRPKVRPEQVEEYIRGEIARWREVRKVARAVCEGIPTDPRMGALGSKLIQLYDGNNISFLLQRYPGDPARAIPPFLNTRFHGWFFDGDDAARRSLGVQYYFAHLERMCDDFVSLLAGQLRRLSGRA